MAHSDVDTDPGKQQVAYLYSEIVRLEDPIFDVEPVVYTIDGFYTQSTNGFLLRDSVQAAAIS